MLDVSKENQEGPYGWIGVRKERGGVRGVGANRSSVQMMCGLLATVKRWLILQATREAIEGF